MIDKFRSSHWLPPLPLQTLILVAALAMLVGPQSTFAQTAQWYKGNLHTHSLWSDGNQFPEMITDWYAQRDYHFLALTDHNILSESEKWMPIQRVVERGTQGIMDQYVDRMGKEWVETRVSPKAQAKAKATASNSSPDKAESLAPLLPDEVRLKKLAEYKSKFEKPGKFLLLQGEEISDSVNGLPVHMNATNLVDLIRPASGSTVREAIAANMRSAIDQAKARNQEILVHLNHPNFGWAVTAEDLAAVLEEQFFEIYNGHPSVNQLGSKGRAGLEKIWDIANTIRIDKLKAPPLFGLATDDSHHYHGLRTSQPGRGWIMVRAEELQPDSLIQAIKQGDFYASSGVVIESIQWKPATGRLEIRIQPEDGVEFTTRFVGTPKEYNSQSQPQLDQDGKPKRGTRIYSADVGKTFATVTGNEPAYQFSGNELYVRAIITSTADHPNPSIKNQKKQAWCQPVIWKQKLDE